MRRIKTTPAAAPVAIPAMGPSWSFSVELKGALAPAVSADFAESLSEVV